jgi:transglutaminase-like putative cysteine protease
LNVCLLTRYQKKKRPLLRVEETYPKDLYLSKTTLWVDDAGGVVKMQEETPVFGPVTYERTTKELAVAPFGARVTDVEAPIAVNKPIRFNRGAPKELVLWVGVEDDEDPATLFVQDRRQKVRRADTTGVELQLLASVKDARAGAASANQEAAAPVPAEYLESNYFLRCDDPLVRKVSREAVGKEQDPRQQIQVIRRWMKSKFKGNYEVPFATADEVARTMEGDCSEMGVLAAAMCRSLGIPSRLVFGLVYDPENQGFGGHLWTEVYLDGDWEPFDPTGVLGQVKAAYIKIADYSLNGVINPDELREVRRVFNGRMKVEVLEAK